MKAREQYTLLLLVFIYIVCKMDITNFLRVSRKRDLCDQSDSGEGPKKVSEGSLEENPEIDSVFTNSI